MNAKPEDKKPEALDGGALAVGCAILLVLSSLLIFVGLMWKFFHWAFLS